MFEANSTLPAHLQRRLVSRHHILSHRSRYKGLQSSRRSACQLHQQQQEARNGKSQAPSTAGSNLHGRSTTLITANSSQVAEQVAHPATFLGGLAGTD
jgi:hypothetical protein